MGKYDPRTGPDPATMAQDRLDAILEDHSIWLDSRGRDGARADLEGVCLAATELRHADLRLAVLDHVRLGSGGLYGSGGGEHRG